MRRCLLFALLCLGLAAFAGCGSDGSSSNSDSGSTGGSGKNATLDLGNGQTLETRTSKPKVAFFGTSGNLYVQTFGDAVESTAKENGIDVTSFDAKFDPARQMEQVQNALQRGEFDAFIIVPLDGNTMCPVLTRTAPAQGVAVFTALVPICNRGLKPEGEDLWSPGTVAQITNDSTYTEDERWLDQVAERLPGRHTVAVLNGPPLITVSMATKKAVESASAKYPDLDFAYNIDSDFSTATSFSKVQTLLQSHPEVDAIVSVYSDMTIGAIKAIGAAGKRGDIKVFDIGGSHQSFEAIRSGDLEMTTYHTPKDNGVQAIRTVMESFAGKQPENHYVGVYPEGITIETSPLAIDKRNVDRYEAQY